MITADYKFVWSIWSSLEFGLVVFFFVSISIKLLYDIEEIELTREFTSHFFFPSDF